MSGGARLWLVDVNRIPGSDALSVAQPVALAFHDVAPEDETTPTLELRRDEVQSLMDELWFAGFRPSNVPNGSDVLNAKDAHIADLRKALFEGIHRG